MDLVLRVSPRIFQIINQQLHNNIYIFLSFSSWCSRCLIWSQRKKEIKSSQTNADDLKHRSPSLRDLFLESLFLTNNSQNLFFSPYFFHQNSFLMACDQKFLIVIKYRGITTELKLWMMRWYWKHKRKLFVLRFIHQSCNSSTSDLMIVRNPGSNPVIFVFSYHWIVICNAFNAFLHPHQSVTLHQILNAMIQILIAFISPDLIIVLNPGSDQVSVGFHHLPICDFYKCILCISSSSNTVASDLEFHPSDLDCWFTTEPDFCVQSWIGSSDSSAFSLPIFDFCW